MLKKPYSLIDYSSKWQHSVLQLNNSEIPKVSKITLEELDKLHQWSSYFKLIINPELETFEEQLLALLIVLPTNKPYQSINYQWFCKHYDSFYYVDRIIVKKNSIGQGFGSLLYKDLQANNSSNNNYITCEVNIKPKNVESLKFHKKLMFSEVGQQDTHDGEKRVSLMLKKLN